MLEDVCSHDIKVVNLNENEVVKHSLLLIRGRIITHNRDSEKCCSKVFLCNGSNCLLSEFCENEEFKFVLELQTFAQLAEGEAVKLELLLRYCTTEKTLTLQLEKPRCLHKLQPIYILCADETVSELAKTHCDQIDVNIRLVQAVYADRIREALDCPLTTFELNGTCQIFQSDITRDEVWSSDEHFLWSYFAEELLRRNYFGDGRKVKLKIVAFIGCAKYDGSGFGVGDLSYGNIRERLKGHAALGGGDLALFSSCFFYAWPSRVDEIISCLRNARPVDHTVEPDESNYRRTYLGVYATTLGAVCHELGHIFELAHTEDGIMGSGFDYLNRLLTITNRTENLPKRIIGKAQESANKTAAECRLTRIKRDSNKFLDNYREQRSHDCFFFTRNCAVILATNKWFKSISSPQIETAAVNIVFDAASGTVTCDTQPLKIIEIREKSNSLVVKYFEFSETPIEKATFAFRLGVNEFKDRAKTHYLYAQTLGGESKRFDFLKSDNEN